MATVLEEHQNLVAKMLARVPPEAALQSNDLDGVVDYIKSGKCKKIFIMCGAGISTSAGILDFRTPGSGLYDNLGRFNLPYPEAVFELKYFRSNPEPFYQLARELAPGSYRPTVTHSFIKLLADKGMLELCATQNIDTLERVAGVPVDLLVEAHGSFAGQHCIDCKAEFPDDEMKDHIQRGVPARCRNIVPYTTAFVAPPPTGFDAELPLDPTVPQTRFCGGLVKLDVLFFGERLGQAFFDSFPHTLEADLLLIMGTSLKIHPFASLAEMGVCPRVLINRTPAGDIGNERDDVFIQMDTDTAVRALASGLGWAEELEALWAKTAVPKEPTDSNHDSEKASDGKGEETVTAVESNADTKVDELAEQLTKLTVEAVGLASDSQKTT